MIRASLSEAKFLPRFFLSLAFFAFAGLALNPQLVIQIKTYFGFATKPTPQPIPDSIPELIPEPTVDAPDKTPAEPIEAEIPVPIDPSPDLTPIPDRAEQPIEVIDIPPAPSIEPPRLPVTLMPDPENLPQIAGFDKITKDKDWIGETPCGVEIFEAPHELPSLGPRQDGGRLTHPLQLNDNRTIIDQPTFLFKSKNGVTLRLVQPIIEYYPVSGRNFQGANSDIIDRKPLDVADDKNAASTPVSSDGQRNKKTATLANIAYPTSLAYVTSGSLDDFRLLTNQTILTAGYLVTLPRWTNYRLASATDKAKWDDLFCNAAHHELGHLRIHLDIISETLDGYAALPSTRSRAEMRELTNGYSKEVSDSIQRRQDAYHVYNGGGLRRGMGELPYAELPFPWLDETQNPE